MKKKKTHKRPPLSGGYNWTVPGIFLVVSVLFHLLLLSGIERRKEKPGTITVEPPYPGLTGQFPHRNISPVPAGGTGSGEGSGEDYSNEVKQGFRILKEHDPAEAFRVFNRILKNDPDNSGALLGRGISRQAKKDYDGALEDFNRLIRTRPDAAEAYLNRGDVRYEKSDYTGAVLDYTHAVELEPDNPLIYFNRGKAYGEMKKYPQALEDLNRAVEKNPREPGYYLFRAYIYSRLNKPNREEEDLQKTLELDPKNIQAYRNLGVLYSALNKYQGADDRAVSILTRGLKAVPDNGKNPYSYSREQMYSQRASALINLERFDMAVQDLDIALELNPEYTEGYFERALAYKELGDLENARLDAAAFLKKADPPKSAQDYDHYGLCHGLLGHYEEALRDFNKAIKMAPDNLITQFNRAEMKYFNGRYEEARAELEKLVKMDAPDKIDAQFMLKKIQAKLSKKGDGKKSD